MNAQMPIFSGSRLQAAREIKGLSRDQLAAAVASTGVRKTASRQSVHQWEAGVTTPGTNVIPVLSDLLGQPHEYFFEQESVESTRT